MSKIKHISREKIEKSQKKLDEEMEKDPLGKEHLKELAKFEKLIKEKKKEEKKVES